MTAQDRISITGFVTVGALVVALGGLTFVQIDWLRGDMNSRIGELNSRIGELDSRIDGVETRMSDLEEAMRELGERMARFEGTLSAVVALVGLNETPGDPDGEARR